MFQIAYFFLLDKDPIAMSKPKESSSFHKRRREGHVRILQEHFEEKEGSNVGQDAVMELLHLNTYQQVQATNAINKHSLKLKL